MCCSDLLIFCNQCRFSLTSIHSTGVQKNCAVTSVYIGQKVTAISQLLSIAKRLIKSIGLHTFWCIKYDSSGEYQDMISSLSCSATGLKSIQHNRIRVAQSHDLKIKTFWMTITEPALSIFRWENLIKMLCSQRELSSYIKDKLWISDNLNSLITKK